MKRLLAAVAVCAVLLAACGGGAQSATGPTTTAAGKTEGVRAVAAARKRAAERQAQKLLREFALPAGTEPLRPGSVAAHGLLAHSALSPPGYGELAVRHGFWQVPRSLSSVLAWVKRHPPQGLKLGSRSRSPGGPANATVAFSSHTRLLAVTLVRVPGRTAVRVDAGAVWIYPRSPQEVVPAGVQTIDVSSERFSRHVTDAGKVSRIIRWFDALDVVQPGVSVICPLVLVGLPVTFDFRSGSGALLARATAPGVGPATQCNPITFSIRGQRQTPLIGGDFVLRVERLLGVSPAGALR